MVIATTLSPGNNLKPERYITTPQHRKHIVQTPNISHLLCRRQGQQRQQQQQGMPTFCALQLDATKKQGKVASACVMCMANATGVVIRTAITCPERGVFA